MDRKEIGKKIKQMRLERGWAQYKLSTEAGVSSSYIRDLESGEKCPTVEVLDNICFAFGISLEEFFATPKYEEKDRLSKLSERQKLLLNEFLNSL